MARHAGWSRPGGPSERLGLVAPGRSCSAARSLARSPASASWPPRTPAMPARTWNVRMACSCVSTRLWAANRGGNRSSSERLTATLVSAANTTGTSRTSGLDSVRAANGARMVNDASAAGTPATYPSAAPTALRITTAPITPSATPRAATPTGSSRRYPAYLSQLQSKYVTATRAAAGAAQGAWRWKYRGAMNDHRPPTTAAPTTTRLRRRFTRYLRTSHGTLGASAARYRSRLSSTTAAARPEANSPRNASATRSVVAYGTATGRGCASVVTISAPDSPNTTSQKIR